METPGLLFSITFYAFISNKYLSHYQNNSWPISTTATTENGSILHVSCHKFRDNCLQSTLFFCENVCQNDTEIGQIYYNSYYYTSSMSSLCKFLSYTLYYTSSGNLLFFCLFSYVSVLTYLTYGYNSHHHDCKKRKKNKTRLIWIVYCSIY